MVRSLPHSSNSSLEIPESHCETVIPSTGSYVLILIYKKDKSLVGQRARIIEKDGKRMEATVQRTGDDADFQVLRISFDGVCEFLEDGVR